MKTFTYQCIPWYLLRIIYINTPINHISHSTIFFQVIFSNKRLCFFLRIFYNTTSESGFVSFCEEGFHLKQLAGVTISGKGHRKTKVNPMRLHNAEPAQSKKAKNLIQTIVKEFCCKPSIQNR